MPRQYLEVISSYIYNRHFRIKQEEKYSNLKEIQAGVPQGNVFGPDLYLFYD